MPRCMPFPIQDRSVVRSGTSRQASKQAGRQAGQTRLTAASPPYACCITRCSVVLAAYLLEQEGGGGQPLRERAHGSHMQKPPTAESSQLLSRADAQETRPVMLLVVHSCSLSKDFWG